MKKKKPKQNKIRIRIHDSGCTLQRVRYCNTYIYITYNCSRKTGARPTANGLAETRIAGRRWCAGPPRYARTASYSRRTTRTVDVACNRQMSVIFRSRRRATVIVFFPGPGRTGRHNRITHQ